MVSEKFYGVEDYSSRTSNRKVVYLNRHPSPVFVTLVSSFVNPYFLQCPCSEPKSKTEGGGNGKTVTDGDDLRNKT